MSDEKIFHPSPYNRDELPSYKEVMSGDRETRIPIAQTNPGEFVIRTNKSASSAAPIDYGQLFMRYLWGMALVITYMGLGLLLYGHFGSITSLALPGWVVFVMGYFVYLYFALRWHEVNKILKEMVDKSEFLRYWENLKEAAPKITWRIICFHEATGTVNLSNRVSSIQMKIPTWTGEQTFPYQIWQDLTEQFDCPDANGYCAFSVSVECVLSDARTKAAYAQQKSAFVNTNKDKDMKYELEEAVDVEGVTFKDKVLVKTSSSVFLSRTAYIIATVFLLAPFWHCKIGSLEEQSQMRVIKKVSV